MAAFSRLERETNDLEQRRRDWIREEGQREAVKPPGAAVHE
jgi:hypothetical protein